MKPVDQKPDAGQAESKLLPAPTQNIEDDFGDESLGERQSQACSMEEGCTVCQ